LISSIRLQKLSTGIRQVYSDSQVS
jgi:hypothetical protein